MKRRLEERQAECSEQQQQHVPIMLSWNIEHILKPVSFVFLLLCESKKKVNLKGTQDLRLSKSLFLLQLKISFLKEISIVFNRLMIFLLDI